MQDLPDQNLGRFRVTVASQTGCKGVAELLVVGQQPGGGASMPHRLVDLPHACRTRRRHAVGKPPMRPEPVQGGFGEVLDIGQALSNVRRGILIIHRLRRLKQGIKLVHHAGRTCESTG